MPGGAQNTYLYKFYKSFSSSKVPAASQSPLFHPLSLLNKPSWPGDCICSPLILVPHVLLRSGLERLLDPSDCLLLFADIIKPYIYKVLY